MSNEEKKPIELTEVAPVHGSSGKVAVRVADPFGIAVADETGAVSTHERGEIIYVTPQTAQSLFRQGKVAIEEMRPAGAPPFVERR